MTFANCPKCGSSNVTTAGVCANCGWSQFAQVTTVSTKITGEIEIMLSGKALLEDYKRLLFENNSLTARIAELEAAQRWHVVADGDLPNTYEPVLTVDMSEATRIPVPAFYNLDIKCWFTHFEYDLWVTHWMPLPELPEAIE